MGIFNFNKPGNQIARVYDKLLTALFESDVSYKSKKPEVPLMANKKQIVKKTVTVYKTTDGYGAICVRSKELTPYKGKKVTVTVK